MTSIEIPEVLWRIEVRAESMQDSARWRDVASYWAALYFADVVVYEMRYSATENTETFEWVESHGYGEDSIRDKFAEHIADKFRQMFTSWGGPIR